MSQISHSATMGNCTSKFLLTDLINTLLTYQDVHVTIGANSFLLCMHVNWAGLGLSVSSKYKALSSYLIVALSEVLPDQLLS